MSEINVNQPRAEAKQKGKAEFFRRIDENVLEMIAHLSNLETLKFNEFDKRKTALIIVDVVNGFVRCGNMHSKRIEDIIPPIINMLETFKKNSMPVIAFADCHAENSVELLTFPVHCLENTAESQIVNEIQEIGGYQLINKNSVNGFFAPDFKSFMDNNKDIDTFIVCGDCTDICIMNFCLSLKSYNDQKNTAVKVIVPIDSVETYDNNVTHNGDLMNIMALEIMGNAGIKIVNSIECD